MLVLVFYCLIRLFFPQNHGQFIDLGLLVLVTFVFSWLVLASFLFMIETTKYTIKGFLMDGIIPLVVFVILGVVGLLFPKSQKVLIWIFGILYIVKMIWMSHKCFREYKLCKAELENYYDTDTVTNIGWMKAFLVITLALSFIAVSAFYLPQKYLNFFILIPFIYSYLIFKIINFSANKIDTIRYKNLKIDTKSEPAKELKTKDVAEKIEPMVEKWIAEKKFCREGLNIKSVASEMGTNQTYLSNYLNNKLGISFQTWLNTLRIEESKILFASKERLSIEEIGIKVGIPQNYNFSRWFKMVTDMTPFQYKRKIQSENS